MNARRPTWYRVAMGVLTGISVLALVGWLYSGEMWFTYQRTLPREPNEHSGAIFPLNVHGILVYQTAAERDRLNRWDWGSIGVFSVTGLATFLLQRFSGEKPDRFKKAREDFGKVPSGFK